MGNDNNKLAIPRPLPIYSALLYYSYKIYRDAFIRTKQMTNKSNEYLFHKFEDTSTS